MLFFTMLHCNSKALLEEGVFCCLIGTSKDTCNSFSKTNESTGSNSTVMLLHDCGFEKECQLQNEVDDLSAQYYVIYN